jgi:hypothetical protein
LKLLIRSKRRKKKEGGEYDEEKKIGTKERRKYAILK